jgi:hypothetical protein
MKTLATEFKKSGFDFKQVRRLGDVAIYSKRKGSADLGFEVIKISHHNGYTIAGNFIPPSETYPSSEQWGTNGFTCDDEQSAIARADKLKTQ